MYIFNKEQKESIISVARMMIVADGRIEDSELLCAARFSVAIGIKPSELLAYTPQISSEDAFDIVSKLSNYEKRFVAAFLFALIISDDDVDEKEKILFAIISVACKLPAISLADVESVISDL